MVDPGKEIYGDRSKSIDCSLGGAAAVSLMGAEAKADAWKISCRTSWTLHSQQQEFGNNNRPRSPAKNSLPSRTLRRRLRLAVRGVAQAISSWQAAAATSCKKAGAIT